MATPYSIQININDDDISQLTGAGMSLCALKAVKASAGNPVVWVSTPHYSQRSTLAWTEQYGVSSGNTYDVPNGTYEIVDSESTDLGKLWEVSDPESGLLRASTRPAPPAASVGIYNHTNVAWGVGLSQQVTRNGQTSYKPIFAYNLLQGFQVMVEPIEKVFLYFDSALVNTGTVITQAYSDGLLIDLTQNNSQAVNYSLAGGWSWEGDDSQFQLVAAPDVVHALVQKLG